VLGVGESKAEKYGKLFVEEIHQFLRNHPIEKIDLPKASYFPPPESDTALATFRLFKQGQSPEQIAESRKLATTTIMSHLEVYIANGEIKDISKFVSEGKIPLIQAAFEKLGDAILSPIMEALGKENFTYDELKIVRAWGYANR
jgi:ATP-dependent DNA helicase RecQ